MTSSSPQQPSIPILDDMESSGGQPHELTASQRTELRTLFESEDGLGLYLFAYIICGCKELYPPLHLEICEFLSKWGQVELADGTTIKRPLTDGDHPVSNWRRLMLCIPRDTFKTTLGTRVNAFWQLTKNPSVTIGIFNENEDKPKQWISAIQQVVEGSRLYQTLWPERLPPGIHYLEVQKNGKKGVPRGWPWGSTGLLFPRPLGVVSELSLKGFGVGGSHAGYHFTHIIKDDIIGEKAAYSEATMQAAVDWVDHSRDIERPAHNGCELFNFTRWGHADVYCWAPESRVWMADGSWKPISLIRAGDQIIGFRKVSLDPRPHLMRKRGGAVSRTELCFTKVVAVGSRPSALVTHLLNDGTNFRCTENHKFYKVWKTGRVGSAYYEGRGLTQHDYSEVKNLTRLRKVMDPFGPPADPHIAGWLGGMFDADGTYQKCRLVIYQSEKIYPEICDRLRASFTTLGINYKEYRTRQETNLRGRSHVSEMLQFAVSRREDRAKFLAWCRPTKHLERIKQDLVARNAFSIVRIVGRSEPEVAEVHWIETETGNYICEGLASKNSHTINKWPTDYKIYHRSQLEDPTTGEPSIARGISIFPSRMTTKQAKEEWERDPFVFSSQRMCLPMAGRETGFQPSWIKRGEAFNLGINGGEGHFTIDAADFNADWRHPDHPTDQAFDEPPRRQIPLSWISKGIILDPAPSRKGERTQEPRARNGIVVCGIDSWGRWFALESLPLREDPVTVLERILELSHKWKTDLVGIEEVNFSAIYAPLWSEILRGRMENQLQFFPLKTEGIDKDTRIRSISGPHREGMVFYNKHDTLDLQQELIEYPYGSTRDLIDAFAYLPKMLSRPQTIQEVNSAWIRRRREVNQRSPLTGY